MPRSIDVVLRNEMVEKARPGDRCVFSGTLIVVPDAYSMYKPGERAQATLKREEIRKQVDTLKSMDGITGLKSLGVRDLSYKFVFLANAVTTHDNRFG